MNAAPEPPTAHVADLLPAFVNGTLDREDRGRVLAHLQACAACRTDLAEWQVVARAARVALAPALAAALDGNTRVLPVVDQTGAAGQARAGGERYAASAARGREEQRREGAMGSQAMDAQALGWPPLREDRRGMYWPWSFLDRARRRWMVAQLAAAALLLLTLGAGFLAFGPLRPGVDRAQVPAVGPGAMADHPLVGTWLLSGVYPTFYPEAASVFSPDGAVTHIAFADVPPHLPIGNAAGRWAPTGARSANFTLVTVIPDGTVTLRAEVEIDASGDRLTGTYDVVTRAPDGTKLLVDRAHSFQATRIKVEQMGG